MKMNRHELRESGKKLYPVWGWQTRLAEALLVDSSTVRRWLSGKASIPGPAAAAVRCFIERQEHEQRTRSGHYCDQNGV